MIGFYDYTVILTYLSILSGTTGIILCLNGVGHPYLGMFFLLFSGLCDTFDGKVKLTVKAGTQNGTKVKLKGKGFPMYKKEGEFGDLYLTYQIQIPTNLSEKENELFTELAKLRNS